MKGIIVDGFALNPGDLSYDELTSTMDFAKYEFTTREELIDRALDFDAVITNKVAFDRKTMDALPKLKYIGVAATGYNIIDIEAAREKGIAVTNIPSYSSDAVAQHVFALLLEASNHVNSYNKAVKDGEWEKSRAFCFFSSTPMFELRDKTIGIIGLGNIGRQVARLAAAFNMKVVSYSPHSRMEGVKNLTLDELLEVSDIITLHCPLSDETCGMINNDRLSKVKKGTILVNVSRGPLVVEDDIITALDEGKLSLYCADVLVKEPPVNNRLMYHEKTIITPHVAWGPIETRQRLLGILVENLKAWLRGEELNRVDLVK